MIPRLTAGDTWPVPWRSLHRNGSDDPFTVSDLGAWLYDVFFLPGDSLLWGLATYTPPVAQFLEIGPADYGGVLSGFVSALTWLLLLLIIGTLYNIAREADRTLTRWIVARYGAALRRARRASTYVKARWHKRPHASRAGAGAGVEEVALDAHELRILDLHAELQPGYALAAREVAAALGVSTEQAQRTLGKLEKLRLLAGTIGGLDGEDAYKLTREGRGFLAFQRLAVHH